MNWYIKYIFSQSTGMGNYLATLGADINIINYVEKLDPQSAQFLVNEFRKNTALTLEQLQSLQFPQKNMEDPYLPSEKRIAVNFEVELPQFSKWILVNLRKLRNGQKPPSGDLRIQGNPLNFPEYFLLKNKIAELKDWIAAMNPDISSFTSKRAIEESDEWHDMMANQGSGKMYEPTKPENIVYGPDNWSNLTWHGWTVQRVTTENDLLTEGNEKNMNHCVGSYFEEVEKGTSVIFSLRDPNNRPHVTMEVSGPNASVQGMIEQIQGNSNQEPDDEYKEMVKEFIMNVGPDNGVEIKFMHLTK